MTARRRISCVNASLLPAAAAARQIAFADKILLNKTDLVTAAELDTVLARIRAINAMAPVIKTQYSAAPLEEARGGEAPAARVGGMLLLQVIDSHQPARCWRRRLLTTDCLPSAPAAARRRRQVLNIDAFDIARVCAMDEDFLKTGARPAAAAAVSVPRLTAAGSVHRVTAMPLLAADFARAVDDRTAGVRASSD